MRYKITQLNYGPDEDTGLSELWAWIVYEDGRTDYKQVDVRAVQEWADIHFAVVCPGNTVTIDLFLFDMITLKNEVHNIAVKFI